ncbi:MAG: hypothetical protein K9L30_02460 [Desulfobacterales bacterium]|nr:hypothetical protein [Desulfobacterales bacterium]
MNIAIIHYHLKTGGVTTVIKQHTAALKEDCDFLILTGSEPETPLSIETVYIPGLGYSKISETNTDPEIVAERINSAIHTKWPEGCDVIHIHNPTLAKNRHFLKILNILKQSNTLFLQIHDFAEDGRPLAYFREEYLSDCHYGVINTRDYQHLLCSGLCKKGLHIIPNTVSPDFDFSPPFKIKPRILYPVRAIRRKNIGEAILLSLFTGGKEIAVTRPPNSIVDFIPYNAWKSFADQNKLNITFEAGLKSDFISLVFASESIISTSITEGFGFAFLEPWLANKLIWGRNLPEICSDFEMNHIKLDHLYSNILIPVTLIDKDKFSSIWKSCVLRNSRRFNFVTDQSIVDDAFEKLTQNETIDFGLLDESFQKKVISSLLSDKSLINSLIDLNPFLAEPGNVVDKESLIENNRKAIQKNYVDGSMKEKLLRIYRTVKTTPVHHAIKKDILFKRFLNLEKFSLLKWGEYRD